MFSALFGQIKTYALYICGAAIVALLLTAGIEYVWIKRQAVTIDTLKAQIAQCRDVNKVNESTIDSLLAERDRSAKTCTSRLAAKDSLIRKLQEIDALDKGGTNHAENPAPDAAAPGGDALLGALNGMYPAPGGPDGVCEAAGPAGAPGAGLLPGSVLYCFCSNDDVKALLKNRELGKSNDQDLREILKSVSSR